MIFINNMCAAAVIHKIKMITQSPKHTGCEKINFRIMPAFIAPRLLVYWCSTVTYKKALIKFEIIY